MDNVALDTTVSTPPFVEPGMTTVKSFVINIAEDIGQNIFERHDKRLDDVNLEGIPDGTVVDEKVRKNASDIVAQITEPDTHVRGPSNLEEFAQAAVERALKNRDEVWRAEKDKLERELALMQTKLDDEKKKAETDRRKQFPSLFMSFISLVASSFLSSSISVPFQGIVEETRAAYAGAGLITYVLATFGLILSIFSFGSLELLSRTLMFTILGSMAYLLIMMQVVVSGDESHAVMWLSPGFALALLLVYNYLIADYVEEFGRWVQMKVRAKQPRAQQSPPTTRSRQPTPQPYLATPRFASRYH